MGHSIGRGTGGATPKSGEPNPLIRLFLCESDINARIARFCDTLFIICEINETQINPSESFWDLTIWVLGKELIDSGAIMS